MRLLLIPLDFALPAVQAFLAARLTGALNPRDAQVAAELLERCVCVSECLVALALRVAGQPSRQ